MVVKYLHGIALNEDNPVSLLFLIFCNNEKKLINQLFHCLQFLFLACFPHAIRNFGEKKRNQGFPASSVIILANKSVLIELLLSLSIEFLSFICPQRT
jgi:hypothetical protein